MSTPAQILVRPQPEPRPRTPIAYEPFCCALDEAIGNKFLVVPPHPYDLYIIQAPTETLYVGKSDLLWRNHRTYSRVIGRVRDHLYSPCLMVDKFLRDQRAAWQDLVVILLSSYSFRARRSAERDLIRALQPAYNIAYNGKVNVRTRPPKCARLRTQEKRMTTADAPPNQTEISAYLAKNGMTITPEQAAQLQAAYEAYCSAGLSGDFWGALTYPRHMTLAEITKLNIKI